ncbi:MAG TPA: MerR family transcriptional regulator [Streptosporangiaceae bacterium]|jgi:DNA-binding transcriptional MerR regulator
MTDPAPAAAQPLLGIGAAAQRTGLSVHALRFYEREGLLASPVARTADGRRRYREEDLEWLELCVRLRSSGMPLNAIRRYTELVRLGPGNERERLAILRAHQQRVTGQIAALTESLELITFKVKLYEESVSAGTTDPVWDPSQPA